MTTRTYQQNNGDSYLSYLYEYDPYTLNEEELIAIKNEDSLPLDLKALNARLQTLNLPPINRQSYEYTLASAFPSPGLSVRRSTSGLGEIQIQPEDSASMYDVYRSRGGTNVDPGEVYERSPGDLDNRHVVEGEGGEGYDERAIYERESSVTRGTPSILSHERMTMGSTWTGGPALARNMYSMRDRLQSEAIEQHANHEAEIQTSTHLATTLTKLEQAESQLRTLQATLIAERVARTQIVRQVEEKEDRMRNYKLELAAAVRALRRAREEGKKTEEEKRRVARAFEEARDKYHEELQVRDARARGREEGRAEAWQEAERWMGSSPPIPVEPISTVPPAVWRTPQANYASPAGWTPAEQNATNQLPPQHLPQHSQASQQPQPPQQPQHNQYNQQPQQDQHPQQDQRPHHTFQPEQAGRWYQSPQEQLNRQEYLTAAPTTEYGQQLQNLGTPYTTSQQQMFPNTTGTQYGSRERNTPVAAPSIRLPLSHQAPAQREEDRSRHASELQGQAPTVSAEIMQQRPMPSQFTGNTQLHAQTPVPPSHPNLPQPYPLVIPVQPQIAIIQSRPASHQHELISTAQYSTQPTPRTVPATIHSQRQTPHSEEPSGRYQPNAAESYLDRVEHDPALNNLLQGAPSRTIHTVQSESQSGKFDDSMWRDPNANNVQANMDKPLPTVRESTNRSRSHSIQPSIEQSLHAHTHHNDGDRYPAFPFPARERGHSRQSSFGSVDPANRPLPASTVGSGFKSPVSAAMVQTPRSKVRSRVAGALRNDGELEELEAILEEGHEISREMGREIGKEMGREIVREMAAQRAEQREPEVRLSRPRQPPSMPSMRQRPVPVMPAPLGKARSEIGDPHRGHSHQESLHVPGQEENDHRLSALGLSGITERKLRDPPKAPTIVVQPPSRSSHNQTAEPTPLPSRAPTISKTHSTRTTAQDNTPAQDNTHHARSVSTQKVSPEPHNIPLPGTRSQAPTVYTAASPRSVTTAMKTPKQSSKTLTHQPNVSVVDFALSQPLPPSRPMTIVDTLYSKRAATVTTEQDIEDPSKGRPSILKRRVSTKTIEPHKVPLPPSRAPTRARASTYAGTVATIDEVTEEESGRETHGRSRSARA